MSIVLCSNCFNDQGLRLDAEGIGTVDNSICPNCYETLGHKLDVDKLTQLAHRFFVWGTMHRLSYGAAPCVQFNEQQTTMINASSWFANDLELIGKTLGVGFFYYGPRLWMLGEVEPLKALQEARSRPAAIERIITEYPTTILDESKLFYRIRKAPQTPENHLEYDSPPLELVGRGRLDALDFPVMYGSQDLEVCIHECRVTAEDELYVATLVPIKVLRLLDLSRLLKEESVTEFESLDMAVHMLFLAGNHSYEISRDIARAAFSAGYDGIVYPSYFSLLRTGRMPFETAYGISYRLFSHFQEYEQAKIISNFALFGRPIEEQKVKVHCINRLILSQIQYAFHFGPVGY